ncbi:MAG: hypothetical protein COA47_06505 [Robiginitomaculum sp.]|nr:MAG: hypothetical protein COA47_06505 [Robiginitomaculum sp.]
MFRYLSLFCLCFALCGQASIANAQMFETNMERTGATFTRSTISANGPQACWALCAKDGRCKAWTWERPGINGPLAMCSLKSAVTPGQFSPCCVSGLSAKLEQQIELGLDGRPARSPRQSIALGPTRPIQRTAIVRPRTRPVVAAPLMSAPPMNVRKISAQPVTQRRTNGVPFYSVNRQIAAAPLQVNQPHPTRAIQPVKPNLPAPARPQNSKIKNSLLLLGE